MVEKTVLLVDAVRPGSISARKVILESRGHLVVLAHSGIEALTILEHIHTDIVLVHSHMDEPPCMEVINEIQRRFPRITVVALTPGANALCGSVHTIDSMRPQDLVRFLEQPAGRAN